MRRRYQPHAPAQPGRRLLSRKRGGCESSGSIVSAISAGEGRRHRLGKRIGHGLELREPLGERRLVVVRASGERQLPRDPLVQRDADTPHVGRRPHHSHVPGRALLRGHVGVGADGAVERRRIFGRASDAEIDQSRRSSEDHVLRLDVEVHEPGPVHRVDRRGDLHPQRRGLLDVERPEPSQIGRQSRPLGELQDQERTIAIEVGPERPDQHRMLHPFEGVGLASEPPQCCPIVCLIGSEHLDDHAVVKPIVEREVGLVTLTAPEQGQRMQTGGDLVARLEAPSLFVGPFAHRRTVLSCRRSSQKRGRGAEAPRPWGVDPVSGCRSWTGRSCGASTSRACSCRARPWCGPWSGRRGYGRGSSTPSCDGCSCGRCSSRRS